jgi:hypothetical protein
MIFQGCSNADTPGPQPAVFNACAHRRDGDHVLFLSRSQPAEIAMRLRLVGVRKAIGRSNGDGVRCGRIIRRAANRFHAGKAELRHSGAYAPRCRTGCGRKIPVWRKSGQACRGIRFPLARTGSVRSAARTQAKQRPNLRARLQLTSSCPQRSRDSRILPTAMVGAGSCQRIKIYVSTVYIEAGFLAPALQVFRIVNRQDAMAVWRKGVGFFR